MLFDEGFKSKFQLSKIRFRSPMVNDENYRLCGGWWYDDVDHHKEFEMLFSRVQNGQKPFANFSGFYHQNPDKGQRDLSMLYLKHELVKTSEMNVSDVKNQFDNAYNFSFCVSGVLEDLFALDALIDDYRNRKLNGRNLNYVADDIDRKRKNPLEDYLTDWDHGKGNNVEPWETGLILGYPIQETMSRCY